MSETAVPTDTGDPDAVTDVTDLLDDDPEPGRTVQELAAEVERLRGEVDRLRAGEEPIGPHEAITTGGHLLFVLGHVNADMRQHLAGLLARSLASATLCAEANHAGTIAMYQGRTEAYRKAFEHARAEADRLQRNGGPEARAAAIAFSYALLPEVHP